MRKNRRLLTIGAVLLIGTFLAAPLDYTLAGDANASQEFKRGSPPPPRTARTRGAFNKENSNGWSWVSAQCQDNPNTVGCAQAAILEVSTECGESAKFFRRGAGVWQYISFGLMVASAGFLGMGAESGARNAKVWSTLGGTAGGLGGLTTALNANATGDLNAVTAINTTLASFNTFVTSAGGNYGLIYETAPIYAKECTAIANSATAPTPTPPPQPAKMDAPTNVVATAGNGQATVKFTAPTNTGGVPIASYTVVASPEGITQTGTAPPITVTGLKNGTAYTFIVTATNSTGTSPQSAASNSVTPGPPTPPGAPTNVAATAGNQEAFVSFEAPPNNGGAAITSFTVTATPGGATGMGPSSPILVKQLTNGTSYTFTITATNSAGTSPQSGASNSVKPGP